MIEPFSSCDLQASYSRRDILSAPVYDTLTSQSLLFNLIPVSKEMSRVGMRAKETFPSVIWQYSARRSNFFLTAFAPRS